MPPSITFLSFPLPTKPLLWQRLDRLRRDHSLRRTWKKNAARATRANAAALATHAASAVIHKCLRLLRALFKGRRSGAAIRASTVVARLLGDLKTAITRTKAFASIGGTVRGVLKRLRALIPAKSKASLPFSQHAKHKRRRVLRVILYCVVLIAALATRARRLRRRQAIAPHVAGWFVATLIGETVATVAAHIVSRREHQRKKLHAAVIEKAWLAWQARREDRLRRKQALLTLLSSACSLQFAEADGRLVQSVATRVACTLLATATLELVRRRAVCRIQRVWRGSRARARVYELLSAKRQKVFRRLQRERVRRARAALLGGSPQDVAHQKTVTMRVAARQEKTTPVRYHDAPRRDLALARQSLVEPIAHRHPPRLSATTGARVLPVTLAKFEKIRARRARVNPLNLWVAIPIAYSEAIAAAQDGNSPSLGAMKPTFDWLPATLLSRGWEDTVVPVHCDTE